MGGGGCGGVGGGFGFGFTHYTIQDATHHCSPMDPAGGASGIPIGVKHGNRFRWR